MELVAGSLGTTGCVNSSGDLRSYCIAYSMLSMWLGITGSLCWFVARGEWGAGMSVYGLGALTVLLFSLRASG